MLYLILIRPVEYLIETIYYMMYCFFNGNMGLATIFVSICVNTLILPMYLWADRVQAKEQAAQKEMQRWTTHIRRHFSGEERMMMLSAYYAEKHYHPLNVLRSLLPLLLQVPFFIAAYHLLSNLSPFTVARFGPIRDLMQEDQLLALGGYQINLLPILMTAINLVSCAVYTKGAPLKTKLQPYLLALFFLILLYHSPAELVLYWTLNNIYSLIKNIIMKYSRQPRRIAALLLATLTLFYTVYAVAAGKLAEVYARGDNEKVAMYLLVLLALCYAVCSLLRPVRTARKEDSDLPLPLLVSLELALALLFGAVIPLLLVASSPEEFYEMDRGLPPLHYVATTFSVYLGAFLIWGNMIALQIKRERRSAYGRVLFLLLCVSLFDSMLYKPDAGTISTMLIYNVVPEYIRSSRWLNALIILLFLPIGALLWRYFRKYLFPIVTAIALSLAILSLRDIRQVDTALRDAKRSWETYDYTIPLSTESPNVIVIMLDRAIGAFVPFLFEEKPELADAFDGFTFYPNTVSFGLHTNYGASALFGGYEYTPEGMNSRPELLLGEKHDEALRLMPVLFAKEGYRVIASDLPLIHYGLPEEQDAVPLFADYPEIELIELRYEMPSDYDPSIYRGLRERSFVFYSILRAVPPMLQDEVYDTGHYMAADRTGLMGGPSFLREYEVLHGLPAITEAAEDGRGTLFLMDSETTHEPAILPLPSYDINQRQDATAYDFSGERSVDGMTMRFDLQNIEHSAGHYHSSMAAFLQLGAWFDRMRELGCYDNTRIILVADHGFELGIFDRLLIEDGPDASGANALLMYKDFNAHGFTTDTQFMTNADTPSLAMQGLLAEPLLNPATGREIDMTPKEDGAMILWEHIWEVSKNSGYLFEPTEDALWYHVQEDIFDRENWEEIRR